MSRPGAGGQASVEALAAGPLLVVCVVIAWQLAALVRGALVAEERLGSLEAPPGSRGNVTVTSSVEVPVLMPGARPLRISARGTVRAP